MRTWIRGKCPTPIGVLLFASVIFVTSGCGGGGSNNSPFAGTWTGPWTDSGNAQTGTLNVTVNNAGSLTGSISNTTTGQNGAATGSISSGGTIAATYTYPSQTYTTTGTVAIGGNGHLTGTVQEFSSGVLFGTATFDLTKQ